MGSLSGQWPGRLCFHYLIPTSLYIDIFLYAGRMKVDVALNRIDEALKEQAIPKRVKVILERLRKEMACESKDPEVSLTTAVYELDEIVNDVNIPMHSKTVIWDLISSLESLKGS